MPRSRPRRPPSDLAARAAPGSGRRAATAVTRPRAQPPAPGPLTVTPHPRSPLYSVVTTSTVLRCMPRLTTRGTRHPEQRSGGLRWGSRAFLRFPGAERSSQHILISTSTRERPVHRGSSTAQSAPALRTRLASIPKVSIRNVLCKGAWRHLATSTLVLLTAPPRSCCWRCAW